MHSSTGTVVHGEARLSRPRFIARHRSGWWPLLLIATLSLLPGAGFGENHYVVDVSHSVVHFSLGDTLHHVDGVFHVTSGDLTFDRKTKQMSGKIIVDAGSGDSGSAARDKKMKTQELKVEKFPSVLFEPKSFTGDVGAAGTSQVQVSGIFTLLGQPHSITVPMTLQIDGDHCTATGTFTVPYVAWGLKDPSLFLLKVSKDVKIDLNLTGQLSPAS